MVDCPGPNLCKPTYHPEKASSQYDGVADISPDTWQLRIEGLVAKPMALKLDDLEKLMDKTQAVTLSCIGNAVEGNSIGNAIWEGVTLKGDLAL